MTRRPVDPARLLRWYPPAWRARYGDELVALMEEGAEGGPTARVRASVAWAGLRERGHAAGYFGDGPAPDRLRGGSLVVLGAWTAFVVAGAAYAKLSEHFDRALPVSARRWPQGAYDAVVVLAVAGAAIVVVGLAAALPAFVRYLRTDGWGPLRRPLATAGTLTAVAVGATAPLLAWAHHLTAGQRNGGNGLYGGAFLAYGLLGAAVLAQWTMVAVAAATRLRWPPRVLRFEAGLAVALAGVMVSITAATAVWWGAMAADAPWFLSGTAPGTAPSPLTPIVVGTMAFMVAASAVAGIGVHRIRRARFDLHPT